MRTRAPSGSPDEVTAMDRGVKIVLASVVLLGGITTALMFRPQRPRPEGTNPDATPRLVLRDRMGPQLSTNPRSRSPAARAGPPGSSGASKPTSKPAATILTPLEPGQPPPELAQAYPRPAITSNTRWGDAIGLRLPEMPETKPAEPAVHKIVDGDTLGALAERYLGRPNRWPEIYEANRDVLPSPEVLPIGVELTIPLHPAPLHPAAPRPDDLLPERPLVPISIPLKCKHSSNPCIDGGFVELT
jgi:nucleoid-associated protein YgaU